MVIILPFSTPKIFLYMRILFWYRPNCIEYIHLNSRGKSAAIKAIQVSPVNFLFFCYCIFFDFISNKICELEQLLSPVSVIRQHETFFFWGGSIFASEAPRLVGVARLQPETPVLKSPSLALPSRLGLANRLAGRTSAEVRCLVRKEGISG